MKPCSNAMRFTSSNADFVGSALEAPHWGSSTLGTLTLFGSSTLDTHFVWVVRMECKQSGGPLGDAHLPMVAQDSMQAILTR
jgi:hypothetical protein